MLKSCGFPTCRNSEEFGSDSSVIGIILLYNEESVFFTRGVLSISICLSLAQIQVSCLQPLPITDCYFLMNAPTHSITSFYLGRNHSFEVIWGSSLPNRNHGFASLKGPQMEFYFPRKCPLVVFSLHKCATSWLHWAHRCTNVAYFYNCLSPLVILVSFLGLCFSVFSPWKGILPRKCLLKLSGKVSTIFPQHFVHLSINAFWDMALGMWLYLIFFQQSES